MADSNPTETLTETEAKPKGKRNPKRLAVIVLLVAALGFVGYSKFVKAPAAAEEASAETAVVEGEIIDVATLTANLSGEELHYARVGFAAVLSADASAATVTPRIALLKDAALTEIGKSSPGDLRTVKGVDDLRNRLTARAQRIWPDGEIVRIVLTEFLVQ